MTSKAVRVQISGRVQGVWFRGWTQQEATRLEVSGWIRNHVDGHVEALFSGPEENVDQMVELCWQGPGLANVTQITVSPETSSEQEGFRVLRGV